MSGNNKDVTALLAVEKGAALVQYLPTGKKKNVRHFWVSTDQATISWDKKKSAKPNKTAPLLGVHPGLKTPRQWFETFDSNGSGSLDASQLATLYRTAREEQLTKKELKAAMAEMDTDGSGAIEFAEFEAWWRSTGGDLEKYREQAFTVVAGDSQMLLVAPDTETQKLWVRGLTAILSINSSLSPANAPGPEPEPGQTEESIMPSVPGQEDSSFSTDTTSAWWLEQQEQSSAVPLSPGSVQQLSVWAKVHSRETKADSVSASGDQQGQPILKSRKSHDGYGAHPVKSVDPCTHPTHDSTGAPISARAEANASTDNPQRSSSGAGPVGGSPASVIASRHHAQDSTMQAVTSCWRPDETSAAGSSTSTLNGTHVTATPRGDCFDKESNHHPEGHWHQANHEGDFSAHLSAHFMSRDSAAPVHVETGGSISGSTSIRGASSSVSDSPSLHPVAEVERTLAGLADHGRGCHSPKYLGSDHQKDGHGLNGHERGHRPLPWDLHASAAPAGLKPYQKSHQKSTVHGHNVDDHGAQHSPKPRLPHHHKLLRSRELRTNDSYVPAGSTDPGSPDTVSDVSIRSALSASSTKQDAGGALVSSPARRSRKAAVKSSPSVRQSPGSGAPVAVTESAQEQPRSNSAGDRSSTSSDRYRGKKNFAPSHNVQGKHHSRHMPWEGQRAAMRTTITMRRVGGAST